MAEIFVELLYFYDNDNNIIAKELACLTGDGYQFERHLFKPPFDLKGLSEKQQNTVDWLSKKYHGLKWDSGETSLENFSTILKKCCSDYATIYSKGLKKCHSLENVLNRDVVNIKHIGCPSFKELKLIFVDELKCFDHAYKTSYCASTNVYRLMSWYNEFGRATRNSEGVCTSRLSLRCFCM